MTQNDIASAETAPSAQGLQSLIDTLPYGLGIFDRGQRLVRWNPPFESLLRVGSGALHTGMDFSALVESTRRDAKPSGQPVGLLLMDGAPPAQPRRVERQMGDGSLLELHLAALPDGGMAISLLDISSQRQSAEALRRTRAQMEQLLALYRSARDEAQRALSAGAAAPAGDVAQGLRAPVRTLVELLQRIRGVDLPGRPREWVQQAQETAQSLSRLMEDLIEFDAVQPGQVQLEPRPFELERMLRELSASYAVMRGTQPREFVFDIDPKLPPRLVGDDRRLRQVLIHLGGQVLRSGGDGERELRIALAGQSDSSVALDINLATLGGVAVAEPPPQTESPDAPTRGLALCRELLRLMSGELQVHGPGAGFGLRLTLPVDRSASVTAGPNATAGLRVLIADSRLATRQALARMGQALGWETLEAGTLGEALESVRQFRPNAAVVAWQLDAAPAFSAALQVADALAGRPLAPVLLGDAAAPEQLAQLPDEQRSLLGPLLCAPATPSMLAETVQRAQALVKAGANDDRAASEQPLKGMRVLLAEDNLSNQIVTRDLLLAYGAQVEIAVDGLDTLTSIVANGRFDAILMDWQMPNMDGLEATREIRQIVGFDRIPIIALTASASAADRAACLAAGMNAHLAKPVDATELIATLLRHALPVVPEITARRPAPAAVAPMASNARIDREAALARLGGNAGLYARTLERFRTELPGEIAKLDQLLQRGDRKQAHRVAHTVKSNAATVGAQQLGQSAQQLETLLAAAATAAEQPALARLREAAEATLKALR